MLGNVVHGALAFAAQTAEFLRDAALGGTLKSLVVVAPPKTLGELRKHYHKEVSNRIIEELPKDLVNTPVARIERVIARS